MGDNTDPNPELDALVGEDEGQETEPDTEVVEETAAAPDDTQTTGENDEGAAGPAEDQVRAHVPVPALLDERAKRQAAEAEANQLRAELAERDAPAPPDPTSDPAGAMEHLQQSIDQKLTMMSIKQSRMMVMAQHEDFAEREKAFVALAAENPSLVDEMLQSDNPALFAYQMAVKQDELAALKDVDGYKAKLRAEVEAEVRAEFAGASAASEKQIAARAAAAGIPSLAIATESGAGSVSPTDDELSSIVAGHT